MRATGICSTSVDRRARGGTGSTCAEKAGSQAEGQRKKSHTRNRKKKLHTPPSSECGWWDKTAVYSGSIVTIYHTASSAA